MSVDRRSQIRYKLRHSGPVPSWQAVGSAPSRPRVLPVGNETDFGLTGNGFRMNVSPAGSGPLRLHSTLPRNPSRPGAFAVRRPVASHEDSVVLAAARCSCVPRLAGEVV